MGKRYLQVEHLAGSLVGACEREEVSIKEMNRILWPTCTIVRGL